MLNKGDYAKTITPDPLRNDDWIPEGTIVKILNYSKSSNMFWVGRIDSPYECWFNPDHLEKYDGPIDKFGRFH